MRKIAFLAMDVHTKHCVLGDMEADGYFRGTIRVQTSEQNIIKALKTVKAKEKYLTLEESTLAYWVARVAAPHVTEVIPCDPKHNVLIYRSPYKHDKVDTKKLCQLLRLGDLHYVYHPENDHRALFKAAANHYIDLRNQQTALKHKIKAMYRYWGIIDLSGLTVFSPKGRQNFLKQVKHVSVYDQLLNLYALMDKTVSLQKKALKSMEHFGCKYPEIEEFKRIPGVGEVGAHIFDAYIQTPHRFANKHKFWRYCKMGVTDHTSDGKPLGFKHLDPSGVSELKAIAYRAWMCAMKGDNEVKRFYSESLRRTRSKVHARLNTQRKILATMYGLWKTGELYDPQRFLDSSISGVV